MFYKYCVCLGSEIEAVHKLLHDFCSFMVIGFTHFICGKNTGPPSTTRHPRSAKVSTPSAAQCKRGYFVQLVIAEEHLMQLQFIVRINLCVFALKIETCTENLHLFER